jgi:hypothetical protein
MSNKWVKIDNDYFEVESIEAQLTIGTHGTISILFNNDKRCNDYLSSWFDESIHKTKSQYIRNISCNFFDGVGCFIKTIDFNPIKNNIYVEFSCDYISQVNISERRDDKINQLLNQTYKK